MLKIIDFLADKRGTTAIEYGIICAMVCIVIVSAVTTVGSNLRANFFNALANVP